MKHRVILSLLTMLFCFMGAGAQKTIETSGEAIFDIPGDMSEDEACMHAIAKARVDAIEKEFSKNILSVENTIVKDGDTDFMQHSSSKIRGRWLGDTKEPEVTMEIGEDGTRFLKARVWGEIRRIDCALPEVVIRLHRSKGDHHGVTEFWHGDPLFVSLRAAEKGYLQIYLQEGDSVYRLLPFEEDVKSSLSIERKKMYRFFVKEGENYFMENHSKKKKVNNVFFFLFSSHEIPCPRLKEKYSNDYNCPAIPLKKFNSWLVDIGGQDEKLQVLQELVTVRKEE